MYEGTYQGRCLILQRCFGVWANKDLFIEITDSFSISGKQFINMDEGKLQTNKI